MTTEEIIARLDRVYYYLSCDKLDKAAIRAAIERLRGDEWPVVMTNGPWLMVMHKCRIGIFTMLILGIFVIGLLAWQAMWCLSAIYKTAGHFWFACYYIAHRKKFQQWLKEKKPDCYAHAREEYQSAKRDGGA